MGSGDTAAGGAAARFARRNRTGRRLTWPSNGQILRAPARPSVDVVGGGSAAATSEAAPVASLFCGFFMWFVRHGLPLGWLGERGLVAWILSQRSSCRASQTTCRSYVGTAALRQRFSSIYLLVGISVDGMRAVHADC